MNLDEQVNLLLFNKPTLSISLTRATLRVNIWPPYNLEVS